ncbi:similar to An12g02130 [Aspergillus luchuensis]|uniref:Similar to An12g02130 n=1 Tax=Aspergillus kawachii TaxID=1069201 RepID=A0A146FHI3_ASPKA|nr:similar to An12g02130 [Aspergillus luchuensis]
MSSQIPQYLFALQSLPLLGSGLYTLLFPASAAQSPYLPLRGVSVGTIQAMR